MGGEDEKNSVLVEQEHLERFEVPPASPVEKQPVAEDEVKKFSIFADAAAEKLRRLFFSQPVTELVEGESAASSQQIKEKLDSLILQVKTTVSEEGLSFTECEKIVSQLHGIDVGTDEGRESFLVMLDKAITILNQKKQSFSRIPEIKQELEQLQTQYRQKKLEEVGVSSFEELAKKISLLSARRHTLGGALFGLGRLKNKTEIRQIDDEIDRLNAVNALSWENVYVEDLPYSATSGLEETTSKLARITAERILQKYDSLRAQSDTEERSGGLDPSIQDALEEEYTKAFIQDAIDEVGDKPTKRQIASALSVIKSLKAGSGEPGLRLSLQKKINKLPTSLRWAIEGYERDATQSLSFAELIEFSRNFDQSKNGVHIETAYIEILQKLSAILPTSNYPYELLRLSLFDLPAKIKEIQSSGLTGKAAQALDKLDVKRWGVLRESRFGQELIGTEAISEIDDFLKQTIIQKLLSSREATDRSVEYGYKLLEFIDEQSLPIFLMNAFRERGGGGNFPFINEHAPTSDRTILYRVVAGMTPELLDKISRQNIPGLPEVIRLIRDNPKNFSQREVQGGRGEYIDNPVFKELESNVVKLASHFLRNNPSEDMQVFSAGLFLSLKGDLGEGYGVLASMLSSSQERVREAALDCCLKRAEHRLDPAAVETMLVSFEKLDPQIQYKIEQSAPKLVRSFLEGGSPNSENQERLSRLLRIEPDDFKLTLDFLRQIQDKDKIFYYRSEDLEKYISLAKIPGMLQFIQDLNEFGLGFSGGYDVVLKDLINTKDAILDSLGLIRKDFPDFEYGFITDHTASKLVTDPYEILINKWFSDGSDAMRGIRYLDKLPDAYIGKAVESMINRLTFMVVSREIVDEIFEFLHKHNLGEQEVVAYNALVEMAGSVYMSQDTFYSEEDRGGVVIKIPREFTPEQIQALIDEGSSEKLFAHIFAFTDTYRYNLDRGVYESSISRARQEREFVLQMLTRLEGPSLKELATIRIFDYLLDPDLGDIDLAAQFLAGVSDPDLKSFLETVLLEANERIKRGEPKHVETIKRVNGVSAANRDELVKLLGFDNPEDQQKLEEEIERVRSTQRVSVNRSFTSVLRVFNGVRRFMTSWELHTRGSSYDVQRDSVEREMGIRSKGTREDPHPIYGAVYSENGRDEKLGGAGGAYGECFFILKNERVKDRTTFTYGDSFSEYRPYVLDWEDATYAKAMLNLRKGSYVEAQILGGVTIDDIESVHVPVRHDSIPQNAQGIEKELERLRAEFPTIKFVTIE